MIGIIGYGYVGKAVEYGFSKTDHIISDPQYNNITASDVCKADPEAVFVCVPTPTDDSDYATLKHVLFDIKASGYTGLVVVKSTVLPHHLDGFDVVYNPEFLSRKTALMDFVKPPFVLIGGKEEPRRKLYDLYCRCSVVDMTKVKFTDVKTAALAKYTFNTFYATKLTFMNQIYDVAEEMGVNFDELKDVLKYNPWMMGVSHLDVPGYEGRGFSGPCLPKDTQALARTYGVELLQTVLKINNDYRNP